MALPGILQRLLDHIHNGSHARLSTARKFFLSGGATSAPVSFDGSDDVDLVVTGLDMSKATAGTLGMARGGTGRTDGKSPAWSTARNLSLTGAVTGSTVIDGSGNISIATTAGTMGWAKPQTAEGVGQWMELEKTVLGPFLGSYTLPAGGTWVWTAFVYGLITWETGGDGGGGQAWGPGDFLANVYTGIAAGGTVLSSAIKELKEMAYVAKIIVWRIS